MQPTVMQAAAQRRQQRADQKAAFNRAPVLQLPAEVPDGWRWTSTGIKIKTYPSDVTGNARWKMHEDVMQRSKRTRFDWRKYWFDVELVTCFGGHDLVRAQRGTPDPTDHRIFPAVLQTDEIYQS